MVQQRILYTNKHLDIKHIINVRFLFPFISNSATLSHSVAWLGTASYKIKLLLNVVVRTYNPESYSITKLLHLQYF
jgi:hypothetical protein